MKKIGMIHGRFQPFSIGHMAYLKEALKDEDEIIIGITNPMMEEYEIVDSHRHLDISNPYTYYQRLKMIKNSILCDKEINNRYNDIVIVPFPINKPEYWHFCIPDNVTQYINILDAWDEKKSSVFIKNGFSVKELNMPRITSATEIRKMISEGNILWKYLVPEGCYKIIVNDIL